MTIQTINIGTTANDGTGDPLRTALDKVNDNFTDTTNAASYSVTASTTDTSTGENGQPKVMRVGDGGRMTAGLRRSGTFNLDVLINEGVYFISPSTDSVSGSLPFGGSTPFILEVIPASISDSNVDSVNRRVIQRAYRYDSSNTESYRASNTLGFFYPWQEILHTGNTGSIVTEDYEEGTWTPAISSFSGYSGITSLTATKGRYVIAGNAKSIQCNFGTDSGAAISVGDSLTINNLPFAMPDYSGAGNISPAGFFSVYQSIGSSVWAQGVLWVNHVSNDITLEVTAVNGSVNAGSNHGFSVTVLTN